MKKTIIGLLTLTMLITLCGCGEMGEQLKDNIIKDAQFAIDNDPSIDKDLTQDIVDALKGENDEHVQFVKGGTNTAHPGVTYGEAFENFFADPSWRYFEGTQEGPDDNGDGEPDYTVDNVDVVEFTGGCVYADTEVTALLQFVLDVDGGTFEPVFLSFNDVPQSMLMLAGLLDKVFTQAEEDLGLGGTAPQSPEAQDQVYDLYAWQGDFYEDTDTVMVSLLVLPSGTEYHCNLYWSHMPEPESGIVSPGVPAVLSDGTTVTVDLNPDGSISVVLDQNGPYGSHYEFEMFQ